MALPPVFLNCLASCSHRSVEPFSSVIIAALFSYKDSFLFISGIFSAEIICSESVPCDFFPPWRTQCVYLGSNVLLFGFIVPRWQSSWVTICEPFLFSALVSSCIKWNLLCLCCGSFWGANIETQRASGGFQWLLCVVMLTPASHVQREPRGEEAFLAPGHIAK